VECVSYNTLRGDNRGSQWPSGADVDEDSFFGRLQERTGLTLDLPTEAEWEYACRAGTTTALNSGKNITSEYGNCANMNEVGWYDENSGEATHPVGQKRPNAWGLYDMHGNVWEWCLDWYGGYPSDAVTDPKGAQSGGHRAFRGGHWGDYAQGCRSAVRDSYGPSSGHYGIGFRVALCP
jgi:formylglycine-generating enzyme required for sulfatase activity